MAHDVFISHSSKDKTFADATCAYLESHKIRCWVAPRDIRPGANWSASLLRAIRSARVIVLILSKNANASPQVKREIERAVHFGCAIIPMRIEEVMPEEDLEYFLGTPHWLDAFAAPLERHLEALTSAVHEFLEIAPAPPSVPETRPGQEIPSGNEVFAEPETVEIIAPPPPPPVVAKVAPPPVPVEPLRARPLPPPLPVRLSAVVVPEPVPSPPPEPKPSVCPPPLPIQTVRKGPPPLLKKVPPPVMTFYENAARRGDVEAQYHLAKSYSSGHGVAQNYATALEWYRKAADHGYVLAQMDLAYMYEMGVGVAPDLKRARRWYQQAAGNGNVEAQAKLQQWPAMP